MATGNNEGDISVQTEEYWLDYTPRQKELSLLEQIREGISDLHLRPSPFTIKFNGDNIPPAQFFRLLETHARKQKWTQQDIVENLYHCLEGKPLQLFLQCITDDLPYEQVKSRILEIFPPEDQNDFKRFISLQLRHKATLRDYYQEKVTLGRRAGLPENLILSALGEGLNESDQRLLAVNPPQSIKEWYTQVQRIKVPLHSPQQPIQIPSSSPKRLFPGNHPPPSQRHVPPRLTPQTLAPPTPFSPPLCLKCKQNGEIQYHWHNVCPRTLAKRPQNEIFYASRQLYQTEPRLNESPRQEQAGVSPARRNDRFTSRNPTTGSSYPAARFPSRYPGPRTQSSTTSLAGSQECTSPSQTRRPEVAFSSPEDRTDLPHVSPQNPA